MNTVSTEFVNSESGDRSSLWTEEVRERLKSVIRGQGSQKEIAEKAGMSTSNLSNLLRLGSEPGVGKLAALCEVLGVSMDYILTGRRDGTAPRSEMFGVPVMKEITASAGPGSLIEPYEESGEMVPFPEPWLREQFGQIDGLRFMQVRGVSMEPLIADGAWVLVDLNRRGRQPGIYVVRVDDALQVKQCEWQNRDRVTLISRNQLVAPYVVSLADSPESRDFEVIGKVLLTGQMM